MCPRPVRTELEIPLAPERVFEVLTDFASYPSWNPVVPEIAGRPAAGNPISFRIRIDGLPALPIRSSVALAAPVVGNTFDLGVGDGGPVVLPNPVDTSSNAMMGVRFEAHQTGQPASAGIYLSAAPTGSGSASLYRVTLVPADASGL